MLPSWAGMGGTHEPATVRDDVGPGVRNVIRNGVPERAAMSISGRKTSAVFDRYNIASESDLAEAAQKMENDFGNRWA
jgi:hypothetical protein